MPTGPKGEKRSRGAVESAWEVVREATRDREEEQDDNMKAETEGIEPSRVGTAPAESESA